MGASSILSYPQNPSRTAKPIYVILAEGEKTIAGALRSSLNRKGIEHIHCCYDLAELTSLLDDPEAPLHDLLIIDDEVAQTAAVRRFLKDLRAATLNVNPFLPIIAMTKTHSPTSLNNLINCGVDAVVTKPILESQLVQMIQQIANFRKPFVVSSRYTGPDRRNDPTRPCNTPLLDAPNSLHDKLFGDDSAAQDKGQAPLHSALMRLYQLRLKRHSIHISFLALLLGQILQDAPVAGAGEAEAAKLPALSSLDAQEVFDELKLVLIDIIGILDGPLQNQTENNAEARPECDELWVMIDDLDPAASRLSLAQQQQILDKSLLVTQALNPHRPLENLHRDITGALNAYLRVRA